MKKIVMLLFLVFIFMTQADASNIKFLLNNKEENSREITKKDNSNLVQWLKEYNLSEVEIREKAIQVLNFTIQEEMKIDTSCELGISSRFRNEAERIGLIFRNEDLFHIFVILRNSDIIDDILYKILKDSTTVNIAIAKNLTNPAPRKVSNLNSPQTSTVKTEEFYAPVKNWPNDISNCSIDTYYRMTTKLTWKNTKERDALISKLNYIALKNKTISLETYNKLEIFRTYSVLNWPIYFKRYADVIHNAKDKLTTNPEIKSTNSFSETYISRKEKITKRDRLYMTYNSTQIMMLAQLIEKTAKRMDAKEVSLHFQYAGPNNETEIYIFSPMEQYRAAIKMLRKEMAELMRSDAFRHTGLQYEDLISAAYETGFIKSEELDYLLKFEDFWNPKTPKWKTYANFSFSLAGTATFYLPPPWNIVGAVGLIFTQSKILNKDKDPDVDDNWNVII